jgi:hypothetical protein
LLGIDRNGIIPALHTIDGTDCEVPVISVVSPGRQARRPARYNLFCIGRTGWSCTIREYGFQRVGTDIVVR